MEIDDAPHNQLDNRHDQAPPEDGIVDGLIKQLGSISVDKVFTDFLQQDIMAQVVVGQLLDKIKGLQDEVDQAEQTTMTLAS